MTKNNKTGNAKAKKNIKNDVGVKENILFEAKVDKIKLFKKVISCVKEVIESPMFHVNYDPNISYDNGPLLDTEKKRDVNGLMISRTNDDGSCVLQMILYQRAFPEFYCYQSTWEFQISLEKLQKNLELIEDQFDYLHLWISSGNETLRGLGNISHSVVTDQKIKKDNINKRVNFEIPLREDDMGFSVVSDKRAMLKFVGEVTMNANEFFGGCKKLLSLEAEEMEIIISNIDGKKQMTISCPTDMGTGSVSISLSIPEALNKKQKKKQVIVQGKYPLKLVYNMCKSSSVNSEITIAIGEPITSDNGTKVYGPLALKVRAPPLGEITYYVMSRTNNNEYDTTDEKVKSVATKPEEEEEDEEEEEEDEEEDYDLESESDEEEDDDIEN